MSKKVFISDENIKGGEPVFPNTKVPISLLFAMLKSGNSISLFLEDFPTVTKEQIIALLEVAEEALLIAQDVAFTYRETNRKLERLQASLAVATEALLVVSDYPKDQARVWVNKNIRED
jgi:uncharacterized protein (DUF433 family)